MRFISTLALALLATAAVVNTAELNTNHILHTSIQSIPHGWTLQSSAHPDSTITYRIAVKQNELGVKQLEQYLLEHSANPASPYYGMHLTREEITQLIKPTAESVQHVTSWLIEQGITDYELTSNGHLKFRAPIAVGNKLFNTEYKVYQHVNGKTTVRTTEHSVPVHLHSHIDFVSPSTRFPNVDAEPVFNSVDSTGKYHKLNMFKSQSTNPKIALPTFVKDLPSTAVLPATTSQSNIGLPPLPAGPIEGVACNQLVTPECFKTQYETVNYTPQAASSNSLAVTGYIGQYFNVENLQAFIATYVTPYNVNANPLTVPAPTVQGDGGDPQGENNAGVEADLDVQTIVSGAYPTPTIFYSTAYDPNYTGCGTGFPACNYPDEAGDDIYPLFLETIYNNPSAAPVISTSYGENESGVDPGYAQRVCTEFMEVAAQGISILYASGDGGVEGGQAGTCDGPNQNLFVPTFPSGCPYLTSVGATVLNADGTESAASDPTISTFGGGGGFSNYFARPSYQDTVVPAYIASLNGEYNGLYNQSGRAFPDVSAIGVNCAIYLSQTALTGVTVPSGTDVTPVPFRVDGTSCASPMFASVLALVNDQRLAAGKPVIGFINPAIYAAPTTGWYDVTTGNNGCSGSCGCGTNGFSATAGWDAATGLGTPRFTALAQYLAGVGQGSTTLAAKRNPVVSKLLSSVTAT